MEPLTDALPAGSVVAGYEIKRVLGQGGFGIAYEAFNADLGERAAIKEFFPSGMGTRSGTTFVPAGSQQQLYRRLLDRFVDEARVVRSFDHPNVVKVRHLQRENNTAYIIMDFVDGSTLGDWVRTNGPRLNAAAIRGMFEPIIGALEHVHARGKLHRDISPMNILVDRSDRPVIIDFGAVKNDWQNDARASTLLIAHPAYAPPERLDREIDQTQSPAIDIYSLGAVMYETIAGQRPPSAQARQRDLAMKQRDPLSPLATVARVPCPPEVTEAVDRSLSFGAEDRPQSMAELATLFGWRSQTDAVRASAPPRETPTATVLPPLRAAQATPVPASSTDAAGVVAVKVTAATGSDDGWHRVRSIEPAPPSGLGAWIAGLPERSTILSVVHGAGCYLVGLAISVGLLSLTGPSSARLPIVSATGVVAVAAAAGLARLARPSTGAILAAWLLLAAGLAVAPIAIAIDKSEYWPQGVLVGGVIVLFAGTVARHRRHDEGAFAMAVMAAIYTLSYFLFPLIDRLIHVSPKARLGTVCASVATVAAVLLALRRPVPGSAGFAAYIILGAAPLVLFAVLYLLVP